jgi:flagellar basal-body rod modification protein FlgD
MIDNISNFVGSTGYQPEPGKSKLGKDDFLRLMVEQLKYQDPLNPMDSTQYVSQLAQFSSVEQLENMNQSLSDSINANYQLIQSVNNTMSSTLIGKQVKIGNNQISYSGQSSVDLGYTLPADASSVKINVYDSSGALVTTIENLPQSAGNHKLSWDFTDNNGVKLSNGDYTFEVAAKSMNGTDDLTVDAYQVGTIEGVKFTDKGTFFVINGSEVNLSDIVEILNSPETTGNFPNPKDVSFLGG